jgi:hypothetical protein
MASSQLDITIEQGATFERDIVYKDSAGDPIDLTAVTSVRGQVRRTYDATTSYAFVCAVTDAVNGEISWTMPATTTAEIEPHSLQWVYDVELVYSGGTVVRLLQGNAFISPEVTR